MSKKIDIFEQIRLNCYSVSEIAKILSEKKCNLYAYRAGKKIMPEPTRKKIAELLSKGKNQKYLQRAIEVQKTVVKHKKSLV